MYLWRAVDDDGEVLPTRWSSAGAKRRGTAADAQASQEAGLRAEVVGDRQAALLGLGLPAAKADLPS